MRRTSAPSDTGNPLGPQVASSFVHGCQNYLQVKEIKLHTWGTKGEGNQDGIPLMVHLKLS